MEAMKTIITHALAMIMVFAIFICGINTLNYILVNDVSSYTRLMAHEFYNQDNIDILCLGASHCYRGIIPSAVSERTGKDVFNASSSSQTPDASFALIKEAVGLYDIDEVFLEISAAMAQWVGNFEDRTDLTCIYLVSDYMRPSINKSMLLLGASTSDYYMNGFFPARRNWMKILDFSYAGSLLRKKLSDIYKNYEYDNCKNENEWYAGNGYVASSIFINEHEFYTTDGNEEIEIDQISEDWKKTIISIIKYCNRHGVKITLYDSPISCFQLAAQGNYDEYISYINTLINDVDAEFAEFNLLKEDYLPYKQTNYKDGHHMNMYGAEDFSAFLSDYINGDVPENAYYKSIDEKLKDLPPEYYGISYLDDQNEQTREIRMISNRNGYFEYKVEVENDGNIDVLQEFNTNMSLDIPHDMLKSADTGISPSIIVTYRVSGSNDEGIRIVYD